jgi:transposase
MGALFCGLDVHKESTYATILDSKHRIDRIGMEASNQVTPLYRQLTKNGYNVAVSHPKKTRYIAEARIKSDRARAGKYTVNMKKKSMQADYVCPSRGAANYTPHSPLTGMPMTLIIPTLREMEFRCCWHLG